MLFSNRLDQIVDWETLGQRIRRAREAQGLSQEDFASRVGKDQTAISAYETGKRRVSAVDLATFAEVLQVPVVFFFEGEFKPEDLDAILLKQFHKIPEHSRREVIEMLHLLTQILDKNE